MRNNLFNVVYLIFGIELVLITALQLEKLNKYYMINICRNGLVL